MIELMVPVAVQAEADQARLQFGATQAAIASCLKKGAAQPFLEALDRIRGAVKEAREVTRNVRKAERSPASKLLEIFGRIGISRKGAR